MIFEKPLVALGVHVITVHPGISCLALIMVTLSFNFWILKYNSDYCVSFRTTAWQSKKKQQLNKTTRVFIKSLTVSHHNQTNFFQMVTYCQQTRKLSFKPLNPL